MTGTLLTHSGTITTSNCIDYGQYTWPYSNYWPSTWTVIESPRECSGDVHVFPCPHCDKCKCGKATVKAKARKA